MYQIWDSDATRRLFFCPIRTGGPGGHPHSHQACCSIQKSSVIAIGDSWGEVQIIPYDGGRFWNSEILRPPRGNIDEISSPIMAIAATEYHIVVGDLEGRLRFWNIETLSLESERAPFWYVFLRFFNNFLLLVLFLV